MSGIDPDLLTRLTGAPMSADAWRAALTAHETFVRAASPRENHWQVLEVAGLPLAMWTGGGTEHGTQLNLKFGNLTGLILDGAQLDAAAMPGVLAEQVGFRGATLRFALLTDARLTGADFSGATLDGADFSRASLRNVNFSNAVGADVDFENCDLRGADFTNAAMQRPKLKGAQLDGVKGLAVEEVCTPEPVVGQASMGSDLYRVKVAAKQDRTVTLRIEVVHPDSNNLSDNESFALMLLREGLPSGADAPLAQEVSFADTLDRGWLGLYTRGFIERVESKIESGSSEGQSKEDWIKGTLTVTVTDPAWISHLAVGAEFDSRAFDVAWDFSDCAPIHPGQVDPNAAMPEAFISVPGALWDADPPLPTVVRAAAYSSSAYRAPALRKGSFTAADLKDLDGQVVLKQGEYDSSFELATLQLAGDSVRLFSVSEGGWGSSGSTPFEGSIGRAELIPGKRLGTRLKLSGMLGNLKPKVVSCTVEADAATFRLAVPPGNTSLQELTDDQPPALGFQLLLNPLLPKDSGAQTLLRPSPLSWTIEREVVRLFAAEERQISQYIDGKMVPAGDTLPEQGGLAAKLARGFISKAEIVSRPSASTPDLDGLSEAQQREALVAPWPEMTVKVTPLHAVYLQHLAGPFEPTTLNYVSEAQPWEGPPVAPATGPTGFGKAPPPPPAAAASSGPSASFSSAPAKSGGSSKVLKIVGIGCGVIVVLFLMCIVLSVVFGQAGSQFARRSAEAQRKVAPIVEAEPDPIPMPKAVDEEPPAAAPGDPLGEQVALLNELCPDTFCAGAYQYTFKNLDCPQATRCVLSFDAKDSKGKSVAAQVPVVGFAALDDEEATFVVAVSESLTKWEGLSAGKKTVAPLKPKPAKKK
ncbi:MAG: pentapeptide repeat-containing protein [Myxococcales bacterium]|nr:pentapeptide repeat-containing protein [Myxococcales bacterium]